MRFQLKELEDLRSLPAWYRDLMTDCLKAMSSTADVYANAYPVFERLLSHSPIKRIIDFGSGGTGALLTTLGSKLVRAFPDISFVLTDLYPNKYAALEVEELAFRSKFPALYMSESVDMTNPPAELEGVRVMLTSFHHLKRRDAVKTLQNAVEAQEPIGIFETTGRTFWHFIMVLMVPFLILLLTPTIKGRRLVRFFFTYLIPIVPLGCLWDGMVSNLRTYSESDLKELLEQVENKDNYKFETGTFRAIGPVKGTYLIGFPRN